MNATVVRFDAELLVHRAPAAVGAWIDWTPSPEDPLCPECHGITTAAQESLL